MHFRGQQVSTHLNIEWCVLAGPDPGDSDLALGTPSSSVNSVGWIPSSGRGNDSLVSLIRENNKVCFLKRCFFA